MPKRTVQEVRIAILKALSDGRPHAYGDIERVANTNWTSVRKHCADLELFGAIEIEDDRIKIKSAGREFLRRSSK